jgi:hypothetical protein
MEIRREVPSEKQMQLLGQPIPQQIDEAEALPVLKVGTATIEERFANWGSD